MQYRNTLPGWLLLSCAIFAFGSLAMAESIDPHAAHRHMMTMHDVQVNHQVYQVPDVNLVDSSGQSTRLRDLLASDKPLAVNFIFTTCTTICPVMTATMLQLEKNLESDEVKPNYISISIDPDYDTAQIMQEYAESYGADWTFLTGSPRDVISTLQAFDAYRGNKVNHFALTLFRAANETEWTRVEGLTSARELARIWRDTLL